MNEDLQRNNLYPNRHGENIETVTQELTKPPEVLLTEEEVAEALRFEEELTTSINLGTVQNRATGEPEIIVGLERIWEQKVTSTSFNLDYFLTDPGREDLSKTFGIPVEEITFKDIEEAKSFFYKYNYTEIKAKTLQEIAGRAQDYNEEQKAKQFKEAGYKATPELGFTTTITVYRNPEVLINKLNQYRILDDFHRELSQEFKDKQDPLSKAKKLLLEIHQQKLNRILSDEYTTVRGLLKQNEFSPINNIATVIKNFKRVNLVLNDNAVRSLSRFDKFEHGKGELGENHDYTQISKQTLELAAAIEQETRGTKPEYSLFEGISPEQLRSIKVSPEEWKDWAEAALQEYGLLSSNLDYDPDRPGRSPDGKWQVVISPTAKSLSANSRQGIIKIPKTFMKSLAGNTTGDAVPTLDHEIAHVIQKENKKRLGLSITENMGIPGTTIFNEAGAIYWEDQCYRELFGENRSTNLHYLRTMQTRLQGGNYWDCVQTFFESYTNQNPHLDKDQAVKIALNRTKRIFRNGGAYGTKSSYVTNSQPLDYLEQELITRQLKATNREELLLSGINLDVLAKLRQYGLVETQELFLPRQRPSQIVLDRIKAKIAQ